MKVILLQDIKSLGQRGDIKNIADGYARNFLLPKKMARVATPEAIKDIKAKKVKEEQEKQANLEKLKASAESFKGKKVLISAKEKDGKLFGSITAKDIAAALRKEDLEISEKSIIMEETIKKTGEYNITVELVKGIQARISLEVQGEK